MERCSPRGAPQKPDGDEPVRSPKEHKRDSRKHENWTYLSLGSEFRLEPFVYVNNYIKYNTHNFASSYEEKAEPAAQK